MAIFQILRGESPRLDFGTTPFCDGCVYFAKDTGKLYIDAVVDEQNKRICITDSTSDELQHYVNNVIKEAIGDAINSYY